MQDIFLENDDIKNGMQRFVLRWFYDKEKCMIKL